MNEKKCYLCTQLRLMKWKIINNNKYMKKKNFALALLSIVLMCSCTSVKDIAYLQDAETIEGMNMALVQNVKIQPLDKVSIIVNCEKPEVAATLNLPYVTQRLGATTATGLSNNAGNQGVSGYTVDETGNIDFPIVGKIAIAGLTRQQAAELIKQKIIESGQDNKPTVTIEFMNLTFSVLGEVNNRGRFSIDRDRITILDAIAMAGDLTITGKRENVLVLRQEDSKQKVYHVDLTKASDIYNSPVYFIKQNDIVYVEPNPMRSRQSTNNGNTFRSASFWMSLASFATSILVLIKNW